MASTTIGSGEIKNKHVADDADLAHDKMAQRVTAVHTVPFDRWRVWDAIGTNLPATPATDDLGFGNAGTYGTGPPYISAGDLKAAGATTRRARCIMTLPPDYEAGETVTIRTWSGMTTTPADGSCTIDFEAWRIDKEDGTLGSADLVTTVATSINSTTEDDKDFQVTATDLLPGDQLDVRMTIICTDTATVTAVIPSVYSVELLADLR